MKWLLVASFAALIEAGAVTAVASAPVEPPRLQSEVQRSDSCQRVYHGRWVRNGRVWHRRRWSCRWRGGRRWCRWRYW